MYIPEIYDGLEKATPFNYGPIWLIYVRYRQNLILQKGGLGRCWGDQLGFVPFGKGRGLSRSGHVMDFLWENQKRLLHRQFKKHVATFVRCICFSTVI